MPNKQAEAFSQGTGRVRPGTLRNAVWSVLDSEQYLLPDDVLALLPSHHRRKQVEHALSAMYSRRKLLEREVRTNERGHVAYAYRKRPVHSWHVDVERALVYAWVCPRCGQDRYTQRYKGDQTPKIMRCTDCDIVVRVNQIGEA